MSVTSALKKYEIAVPRRMRVAGDEPMRLATAMMMNAGMSAPMKALVTIPISPTMVENDIPEMIAATAPRQAPDEIPVA